MPTTLEIPTRASLLDRARDPADQKAWADFVECYAGLIRHWCRGLQDADRDDVTQAILCRLFKKLPEFQYDPNKGRFRGWLHTISHHAIVDHVRKQGQPGGRGSGDTGVLEQLQKAPAPKVQAPDEASIEEPVGGPTWRTERVQRVRAAWEAVSARVEPRTWLAFWLTTVEGQSAEEVADQLRMKRDTVLVYKCRVIKMIRSEIEGAAGGGTRGARPSGSL